MNNPSYLPNDPEQLKTAFLALRSENAELRLLVEYLQKKSFRRTSEAYVGMQPLFVADKVESSIPETEPAKSPRPKSEGDKKPVRKALPADMPRHAIQHVLSDGQLKCTCGGEMHQISSEVLEQLDIIPASVKVLRHERAKYACRSCESVIKTAPMPIQPIPKSLASPATLAHIAVAKYADHLPLYRQEELWERLGVSLDRGTMATWMIRCGELVRPIINLMRDDMVKDGVVHCDESTIRVLDKKPKDKKSSPVGQMWVLSRSGPGPQSHIFTYDPSRSGKVAAELLDGFKGVVVTDGFGGYRRLSKSGMTRAGCWAHVRRKFFEATEKEKDSALGGVAHKMLRQIQRLYRVERLITDADAERRLLVRQRISRRIVRRIESLLDEWIGRVPARGATGSGLGYLRSEWEALQVFLRDERVPIDNNRVENAIRPLALGRKNWLFAATSSGADASANIYSLIQTAVANGIEPQAYLAHVFSALPNAVTADDVAKLLPYPDQH